MQKRIDKTEEVSPVNLIFGEDELKVSETARSIVDRLCPPERQSLALEIVDGDCKNAEESVEALKQTVEALRTVGFFGGGKTVWLRRATFLDRSPPGNANAVKEMLKVPANLIEQGLPAGCHLVVSSNKVFKGSAFYKTCKAHAALKEFSLASRPKDRQEGARSFAKQSFGKAHLQIDNATLETFIGRCGNDSRQIAQEIEKLSLYLGDNASVSTDDIVLLTPPLAEAEHWELTDAVCKRNLPRAVDLLRQETNIDQSAIGIIIRIENRLRQLLIVRECLRNKFCSIVRQNNNRQNLVWKKDAESEKILKSIFSNKRQDPRNQHPFRQLMLAKDSQRYSRSELRTALRIVRETHEILVSQTVPKSIPLEIMFTRILPEKS